MVFGIGKQQNGDKERLCRPLFSLAIFPVIPHLVNKSLDTFFGIHTKIFGRSIEGFLRIDDSRGRGIIDHYFASAAFKKKDFIALFQVQFSSDFNRNRYLPVSRYLAKV